MISGRSGFWHDLCFTGNIRSKRPDGASRRPRGDAMTMDLWYDLAARELPDLDADVLEKLKLGDIHEPAPDAEPEVVAAVDFF